MLTASQVVAGHRQWKAGIAAMQHRDRRLHLGARNAHQNYNRPTWLVTECFENTRQRSKFATSFGHPTDKEISSSVGLRPSDTLTIRILPLEPAGGSVPKPPL